MMIWIGYFLSAIWMVFIVFWDSRKDWDGRILGPIKQKYHNLFHRLGLEHHWKLYTEGNWELITKIEIHIFESNGQANILPINDVYLAVWFRNVRSELYRSTLQYYLRAQRDATMARLVLKTKKRPPDPPLLGTFADTTQLPWSEKILAEVRRH
jgi:hypothetical protein